MKLFAKPILICNSYQLHVWCDQGPFLGLRGFHYAMLCHCSLHNVNLGVAQDANGSTLFCDFNKETSAQVFQAMLPENTCCSTNLCESAKDVLGGEWIFWRPGCPFLAQALGGCLSRFQGIPKGAGDCLFPNQVRAKFCS